MVTNCVDILSYLYNTFTYIFIKLHIITIIFKKIMDGYGGWERSMHSNLWKYMQLDKRATKTEKDNRKCFQRTVQWWTQLGLVANIDLYAQMLHWLHQLVLATHQHYGHIGKVTFTDWRWRWVTLHLRRTSVDVSQMLILTSLQSN